MDEQLRNAALEYHRLPTPRQDLGPADQGDDDPARPFARVLAGRRRGVRSDRRQSRRCAEPHRARQSRRRDHQRHRRARARQHRRACRQAGDGRQGRAFSRSSPASTCSTSRSTRRDPDKLVDIIAMLEPTFGGINLEDIKAPECFYIEKQAARAPEDSGVPRRPARHGDHRRRRGAERLEGRGQGHRQREARLLGRRRRRARVPRPAGRARHASART